MFYLELVLNRACNQKCSYCTTFTKEITYTTDIVFIREILNDIPLNIELMIVVTGGEPGLCTNLDEVIKTLKNDKHNITIRLMSNGLVRLNYPNIIKDKSIFYFEHIWETYNKKFYTLDFFNENTNNNYNVIVITEDFIDNYNIKDFPIHKNIWFKLVNLKSDNDIINIDKFKKFYDLIYDKSYINLDYNIFNPTDIQRKQCALNPPVPCIDLNTKEIYHCSKILNNSLKLPFNKNNFKLLLQSNLFTTMPTYCIKCFDVNIKNRIKNKISSLKGNYKND